MFGIRFNDEEESYFALEIDRGEMPVQRYQDLYRTHYAKKMLTYYEASRQQRYLHDLGINAVRVATVTTTPERAEQMLEALKRITDGRGSSMFLFTNELTLATSNPLDVEWSVAKESSSASLTDTGEISACVPHCAARHLRRTTHSPALKTA